MIKQKRFIVSLIFFILILTACSAKEDNYNQYISSGNGLTEFAENFNALEEGTDFFSFEYADENKIMIRNYAYLVVMKPQGNAWAIDSALDLRPIGCSNTQGDFIALGYVGNGVAVQIAYPAEQNEAMPFWGNCRLIFYNLMTGETWQQHVTEGYEG